MRPGKVVRWLRRRLSSRSSEAASGRAGDEARDAGLLDLALLRYSEHLAQHPRDWRRWVQLGHVSKEAGDRDRALRAYRAAESLRPRDADLLLHFAHLQEVAGNRQAAERLYARSIRYGNGDALTGLRSLRRRHGWTIARTIGLRAAAIRLAMSAAGATVEGITGFVPRQNGVRLRPRTDGAIRLTLQNTSAITEVRIVIRGRPFTMSARCAAVIEYGSDPAHRVRVERDISSDTITFLIAHAARAAQILLTFEHVAGPLVVSAITARPLLNDADIAEAVRRLVSDDLSAQAMAVACEEARTRIDPVPATMALDQAQLGELDSPAKCYALWWRLYGEPAPQDYNYMREAAARFSPAASFAVLIPVFNPPLHLLERCIASLLDQIYPAKQICIADDASTDLRVRPFLQRLSERYPQVKVDFRQRNGHIAAASNSALALADADYIVLVDQDDELPAHALWTMAFYIDRHPDATVFFSDEDKIEADGAVHSPYMKGDFDRYLMFGHNMVSHLGVYQRILVNEVGGFREGLDGSQDYDLLLRCLAKSGDHRIIHVPHVLYHWRVLPGSTAGAAQSKAYAEPAARRAINDHLSRTDIGAISIPGFAPGVSALGPARFDQRRISIIILTRDRVELLRRCVGSVIEGNPHDVEIIIIDNGSRASETLAYLDGLANISWIRVIRRDVEFNFSSLNSDGAALASGEILCFLNNDTQVRRADWLDRARMLLAMPDIGVVGARLLYPDDTVQHFGLGVGMVEHGIAAALNSGLADGDPGYFGKALLLQQFSAVTAACMFVRKSDFDRVGGFDEALGVSYNDVDLCLRFRQAGLRVVCDPDIVLLHEESISRGRDTDGAKRRRLDEEAAIMRERWSSILNADPFLSPNHALHRVDQALAYPPRLALPWKKPVAV